MVELPENSSIWHRQLQLSCVSQKPLTGIPLAGDASQQHHALVCSVPESCRWINCVPVLAVLEGWPPSLKCLSLPELSAVLEECVGEMGKVGRTLGMWRDCCAGGGMAGWGLEWLGETPQSLLVQEGLQALQLVLFLLQILGSASSPGDSSRLRGGGWSLHLLSVVRAAGEVVP